MFNRNNKFSNPKTESKPKIELNALYDGKGTGVEIKGNGTNEDLLHMFCGIAGAFLKADIDVLKLTEMLAVAEAVRRREE